MRKAATRLCPTTFVLMAAVLLCRGAHGDEPNQAGLLVQFGDGQVETRCVTLGEGDISGADLLALTDLEVTLDPSSGMGITVCQIEGVGCPFPGEPCFCRCLGGSECRYWNYFYRDLGDPGWAYSPLGATLRRVRPGSVDGWVWGDGDTPPDVALTFDTICAPPTATRTAQLSTPLPATHTAAPTETRSPLQPVNALPKTPGAASTSIPSPTRDIGQDLGNYWPLGFTLLALILIGALVLVHRA